jgi:hypothetical protein
MSAAERAPAGGATIRWVEGAAVRAREKGGRMSFAQAATLFPGAPNL